MKYRHFLFFSFVLIVADDLGYADLGIHGSKQIPTPFIDRLAEEGIMFTSSGFDNNLFPTQPGFDPNYVGLPLTETTSADRLKPLKSHYLNTYKSDD